MPSATTTHRFGPFHYDTRTGELSRDGATVRLSPRLAAVIEVLLEHPGELVERETLRQRIWHGDTYVDFEHGLTAAINELRAALGDSAHRPTYIETMPRRGYRWLAPVERIEAAPGRPVVPSPLAARRRSVLSMASAVVVALALVAVLPQLSSRRGTRAGAAEARRLTARGEFGLSRRSADDTRNNILDLRRALELDPGYAPAYAALARAYITAVRLGHLSPREAHPAASEAARAAVGLDPGLAAAHLALGDELFFLEWDPDGAEAEMRRARDLAPEDPAVLGAYARFLRKTCRFEEAIAVCRRLLDRDPHRPIGSLGLATAYIEARRFDEAVAVLRPVVEGTPAVSSASMALAEAYAARGDCIEALALADRARPFLGLEPEDEVAAAVLGWVLARCGREADARATARAYEESGAQTWVDPITMAALLAALGDTEDAIRLVERGVEEHSPTAMSLEIDFMLDPLRHDPRFAAAVDRVRDGHPARTCAVPAPAPLER